MMIKRKRNSIINWFNSIIIVDSPLEALQQLSDGRHFKKLIGLIDPTTEEELSGDVDTYKFTEEFLNGYFHSQVGAFIDTAACSQGDEMELAKVSILLLSAVVQSSLSKESDFLGNLIQLDESVQEDIKDFMQAVILPNGDRLSADFGLVLTQRKQPYSVDSPLRQTPRRSTRRNSVISPTSPLMTLIDSPMFARQTAIRNLKVTVTSLRQQLHAEENRTTEMEMENRNLKQSVKNKENEVKELREKMREIHASKDSVEESSWASVEQYKAEIQSLTNQLKEYQNIQLEFSRLQKENEELLSCNSNIQSQLEDHKMTKIELHKIAADLNQAQATIEGQKDFIEKLHIENNSLKKSVDEKENEVNTVRSLYDDAMQEVRNLQNSPELPKGESMKVVVEMQVEELEKEIRRLKEREIELTDHLKTSARRNDTLKKNIEEAEEKCIGVEERLATVMNLNEKELSKRDSRIAVITNENHSLHEKLQSLRDKLNQQKEVEEQKAKAHMAEVDHLKVLSKQEQIRYKESIVSLRTDLSEASDQLKIHQEREKENITRINQLLSQNNSLSCELEQKTRKLCETESSSKTSLEGKEREICELRTNVDVTKQQNCNLEKKLQDLLSEIESFKQAAEQESKAHTNEMECIMNHSKQVLAEYEGNKVKLLNEISDLNSKLKYCGEKEQQLSHELELTKTKLGEKDERLCIVLKESEKELTEFRSTVSALKKENHSLEEKIQNLIAEKHQVNVAREQTSEAYSSEIKHLKEKYEQQLELCADKQNKLTTELSDACAKLKLYSEMERQNKSFSQASTPLEGSRDWKAKYDEIQLKFSKQVEVCDGLRGALDKLVVENGVLQTQLNTSRMQYDELAKKSAAAEQNCVILASQKKDKDKEVETLSRQVQDLQNTLNQKDEKYDKDVRDMQGILEGLKEKTKSSEARLLVAVESKERELREVKKEKDEIVGKLLKQIEELQNLLEQKNQFYGKEVEEMQDLIKRLKQENKSVKEQNSSFEGKSVSFEKELQKAKEIIESKETQLKNMEDCLKDAKISFSELSSEMHRVKLEKTKLEEHLDEKNRLHLYTVDSEKQTLEKKLKDAKQEINTLAEECKKKDESIDKLSKQVQMLEKVQAHNDISYKADIKKFKDSLQDSQEENRVLKSEHMMQVQNLCCRLEEKEKDLEKTKKEIQELEEAYRMKESELKALKGTLQDVEASKSRLLSEMSHENGIAIENLRTDLEKEREDNRGLQSRVEDYESEKSSILQQVKESERNIASLTEQKQKLDEDVHKLSKQLQDLQHAQEQMAASHELEIRNVQDLLQKSLQEKKDLESNHTVLVQNLNRCIEDKTSRLEKLTTEVQELRELKSQKENEIESVQKSIEELEASNSSLRGDMTALQTETLRRTADFESEINRLTSHYKGKENEINKEKKTVEDENEDLKNKIIQKDERVNEVLTMLKNVTESMESEISGLQEEIRKLKELLEMVTIERNNLQKHAEALDASKQDLMEKLQDTERRQDNLVRQKEIAESDFSRCVEKRDEDIEKLNKRIQELEVKSAQQDSKSPESNLLKEIQNLNQNMQQKEKEIQNLNQNMQQKEKEIQKSFKKIQELDYVNKQKDESLKKIRNSMEEVETARRKLLTEISCLNEEKQIDKEKIDKLTSECKRLSTYSQQQKKMIEEMKELQAKLLDTDKENKAAQQKFVDYKRKTDQRIDLLKRTIAKLENEKEELEKCLLSLKQKVIGYQSVSESCKQALVEERKRLKSAQKELEDSEMLRDELSKQINSLEQSVMKYKQQKFGLENEVRRTRSELNVLKNDKCDQDFHKPVSRRFSSPFSPFVPRSQERDSSLVDSQFLSPCVWKKPAVIKKRISNASSLASTVSTSSETVNNISALTPIKAGANLFLPLADEEDFLNYSSLAELKSGPPGSVTKSSTKRLGELQRRNTLCPPHMRSSYPVETQMRPVCEFTDEIIKSGFVASDQSQREKVSAQIRSNTSKAVRPNVNRIVHESDNKGVSPKRKRTGSNDSNTRRIKVKKISKTTEFWEAFKVGVASPRTEVLRTPTALKNIFGSKKRVPDAARKGKAKRF